MSGTSANVSGKSWNLGRGSGRPLVTLITLVAPVPPAAPGPAAAR